MIQDHKVTVFYTAPTAIRSLIKAGGDLPKKYDLSSLRILGTVGEPINPEAWMWYYETVGGGRCPIVDTWWQTETGGHMITPLPGATPTQARLVHAAAARHHRRHRRRDRPFGRARARAASWSSSKPWPSMIRTIWGDPERFKKTYYPDDFKGKYYLAGDGASTRRRRLLPHHGPHRRRAERLRATAWARWRSNRRWSPTQAGRRGRGGRAGRTTSPARRSCAFVVLKRRAPDGDEAQEDRQGAARLGRQGDRRRSPSPRTSASATTCRRRAPARSCAGCCARSPRARRSRRTSRRWRTRRSWSS